MILETITLYGTYLWRISDEGQKEENQRIRCQSSSSNTGGSTAMKHFVATVHMCEFWRESEVYLIRIYAHGKITWRARVYPHVPSFSIHTVAYRLAYCKNISMGNLHQNWSSNPLILELSRIEGVESLEGRKCSFLFLLSCSRSLMIHKVPSSLQATPTRTDAVSSYVLMSDSLYIKGEIFVSVWVSTCRNATSTLIQSEAHSNDSLQVFYVSRHGMLNVNGPTGKPSIGTTETDMSLHDCMRRSLQLRTREVKLTAFVFCLISRKFGGGSSERYGSHLVCRTPTIILQM